MAAKRISRTLFTLSALVAVTALTLTAHAKTINVRGLGAVGDGIADDSAAFQAALNTLRQPDVGKLFIPAGQYRITETLEADYKASRNVMIEGEGPKSLLFWDGDDGGTLLLMFGMGHTEVRNLQLRGQPWGKLTPEQKKRRAGVLFQTTSVAAGNHINRIANVIFHSADIGVKMARKRNEICNADYAFTHIHASNLGTFFQVTNDQGVDYLFNFLFALQCDKVLDFQRGGNLTVNNAQMTGCSVFLNIEGGGRNAGTFVLNNIRHEGTRNHEKGRDQLLRATDIEWEQALVKFIGFDDCQWSWFRHDSDERFRPLCEIGPGVNVTFESSIFNGPVARINGKADKPGSLVLRECTFGFILPHQAIQAGTYGYVYTEHCFSDFLEPLPNIRKWPDTPTMSIPANDTLGPYPLPPTTKKADDAIETLRKQRNEWVKELEKQTATR
ncbi:MAG: glycoside hydrolase family 55 protein [Candidatus Pacebacteria bacterium]|nr:glycoside hydrolase family 55 protein [Candidatus Paceibacterota bacterium]